MDFYSEISLNAPSNWLWIDFDWSALERLLNVNCFLLPFWEISYSLRIYELFIFLWERHKDFPFTVRFNLYSCVFLRRHVVLWSLPASNTTYRLLMYAHRAIENILLWSLYKMFFLLLYTFSFAVYAYGFIFGFHFPLWMRQITVRVLLTSALSMRCWLVKDSSDSEHLTIIFNEIASQRNYSVRVFLIMTYAIRAKHDFKIRLNGQQLDVAVNVWSERLHAGDTACGCLLSTFAVV